MQRCCSILLIRTIGDWSVALEQDTGASTTGWDECEEEHNREREWLHLVIKQSGAFVWWLRCTNQRAKLFWREFFCTIKSNPIPRKWCFKKASKTVLNSQNLMSGLTKLKTQQANHKDFVHNKLCTQEDLGWCSTFPWFLSKSTSSKGICWSPYFLSVEPWDAKLSIFLPQQSSLLNMSETKWKRNRQLLSFLIH